MSGPLHGVKVLDLTSVVMGPYATQILGEYGADVIKVEPPEGDIQRLNGPMRHPRMGAIFLTTNRGKRSIVIDLKKAAGRDLLLKLAESADVLVYNLRPQAMARLGLSYEVVREVNPRIVYIGAFGFSQRGPYASRPAYDDLIQGMCGVPWLTQRAGADIPRYAPMILADRTVGLQLATAIVSGLFHRERTGVGQRIDVPMFEGLLSVVLGEHLSGTLFRPPQGPTGYQRSLSRDRRPYRTSDGYLCAMVYNDKHWLAFLTAIGEPERFTDDARFSSQGMRLKHIDEVYSYLASILTTKTTAEWMDLFARTDIPAAPMYSIDDILSDEHVLGTGFVKEVIHPSEGPMLATAIPTEWSASSPDEPSAAPRLGEHSTEILLEAGFSSDQIETMLVEGIIEVASTE